MYFVTKFLKLVNSPRFSIAQVTLMIASFGFIMGLASEITGLEKLDKPEPTYATDVTVVHAEPIPESSHDASQSDEGSSTELAKLVETIDSEVASELASKSASEPTSEPEPASYIVTPPSAPTLTDYHNRLLEEIKNEADLVTEPEPEALVNIDIDTDSDVSDVDASDVTASDVDVEDVDAAVSFDEQLRWVKNNIYLYFTEEEIREVTLVIQGEDEVSGSETEWAAHAWVILTRLNHPGFKHNDTIHDVLTAPGQFAAYEKSMHMTPNPDIGRVVVDVMARYILEQSGFDSEEAGRVIPATHLYWNGNTTGTHNLFYASSSHRGEPYEPTKDALNTPYDT